MNTANDEKDLTARVLNLLDQRRYDDALAEIDGVGAAAPSHAQLRRRCLARTGAFEDAAAQGRFFIATGRATLEDYFRQSQILLKCGLAAEAFETCRQGLVTGIPMAEHLMPMVQAALADSSLMANLQSVLDELPLGPPAEPPPAADVSIPMRLPHYRPLDGPHPWIMGLVEQTKDDIRYSFPNPEIGDLAGAIRAALPRAISLTERLVGGTPGVSRLYAAEYVGARFITALYPTGDARLDLLSYLPMTIEPRPFVMFFDFMPVLFQPFFPTEHMNIGPDSPLLHILRDTLTGPNCRAIITTYTRDADLLGGLFDSRAIAEKCVRINTVHSMEEISAKGMSRPVSAKPTSDSITLFFPSSFNWKPDGFYMRGGVEVINAFLDLVPEFPNLRLIMRTKLPDSLSPRLQDAVRSHPGIEWLPEYLDWDRYQDVLDRATILAQPAMELYRNTIVQSMSWGMVPVIAQCTHGEDFIENGVNGVIVPRTTRLFHIDTVAHSMTADWRRLYSAVDQPADHAFFNSYREMLACLIRAPDRLRQLSTGARAAVQPRRHSTADRDDFLAIMRSGLNR